MIILQVIHRDIRYGLMFGTVKCRGEFTDCVTLVGQYGYHPHLPDNTRTHFGQFKLVLS
jgi:hypothetical protein